MLDWITVSNVLWLVFLGIIAMILKACALTVETQTVAIIERFSKYNRIAKPGLSFMIPFIEKAWEVELHTLKLSDEIKNMTMNTKTKDNVFVSLLTDVQYTVIPSDEGIQNAFYKMSNPEEQMLNYFYRIILNHIPETDLESVYTNLPAIQLKATTELASMMEPFGYHVMSAMITGITPAKDVVEQMNRIVTEKNRLKANEAEGEANKMLAVKEAEADAEVKRLNGMGIAMEREAIAKGWHESIEVVRQGTELSDKDATFLLLFTNWTDMMKSVGESDNTTMVFMPSGPEGLLNFQQTMTNALLADKKG